MTDRGSPLGYVIFAAGASAFAWLYAIMNQLPMP